MELTKSPTWQSGISLSKAKLYKLFSFFLWPRLWYTDFGWNITKKDGKWLDLLGIRTSYSIKIGKTKEELFGNYRNIWKIH